MAGVRFDVRLARPNRRVSGAVARLLSDRRVRYLVAGGVSSVLYYAIFSAGWLASGGRIPYLAMALIGNVAAALLSYPLYRKVFGGNGPWVAGFLRFYLICFWSLVFIMAGLPLLIEVVGLPVLLAQALLIVTGPVVNYQLLRLWAFRR